MGLIELNITPNLEASRRVKQLAKASADIGAAYRKTCEKNSTTEPPKPPDTIWYSKLSALMCWDAAVLCALAARGIYSHNHQGTNILDTKGFDIVSASNYNKLFPNINNTAGSTTALQNLPEGCFVGFIDYTSKHLRHVMIHIENGLGAGNKNACIFTKGSVLGWESQDMTAFFSTDSKYNNNQNTFIVYAEVKEQWI